MRTTRTLGLDELQRKMQGADPMHVINVLPEKMFKERHIPGSINIPVSDDDFVKKVEQRVGDKTAQIVVYCKDNACDASPKAAAKLEDAGFTNVYDFEGGMEAWAEKREPATTGA